MSWRIIRITSTSGSIRFVWLWIRSSADKTPSLINSCRKSQRRIVVISKKWPFWRLMWLIGAITARGFRRSIGIDRQSALMKHPKKSFRRKADLLKGLKNQQLRNIHTMSEIILPNKNRTSNPQFVNNSLPPKPPSLNNPNAGQSNNPKNNLKSANRRSSTWTAWKWSKCKWSSSSTILLPSHKNSTLK